MARRKSKIEATTLFTVILAVAAIALATRFFFVIGPALLIVGALPLVAFAGYVVYLRHQRAVRLAALRAKYKDEQVVNALMGHEVGEGQTEEQLLDAKGQPPSIDNVLMKTRTREVWKYQPNGRNRYRLRITLDDGVVVSYEQKRS